MPKNTAIDTAITKNYAKALFVSAKAKNALDKTAEELENFAKNFKADFVRELKNPAISKKDLVEIMKENCQKFSLSKILTNFLLVLAENRRLSLFSSIKEEFEAYLREHKNILEIEIITAKKAGEKQLDEIKGLVAKKYPKKTISIISKIDEKILGGFEVRIGSQLIDATTKTQLTKLAAIAIAT
jgi:F-type H+-transporting ATPase subunit delta